MFRPLPSTLKPFPATISLDGEMVALLPWERSSLRNVRRALETLALRRQRVLVAFNVDGKAMSLHSSLEEIGEYKIVAARTAGIDFLGVELLTSARRQTQELIDRVRQISLLVLINNAKAGKELWLDLQPDLREPLLTLSFLPEISQISPEGVPALTPSLIALTEELAGLSRRMDALTSLECDVLTLSEGFDLVLSWLNNLMEAIHRARSVLYAVPAK